MKNPKKYLWLLLFLLAAVAILFGRCSLPGTGKRVMLPDGREISVRAVTVGTNSIFTTGNLFRRTVARVLPRKFKARLNVAEMQVKSDPRLRGIDFLTVWVEIRPPIPNIIARVGDDSGREQVAERPNASGGMLPSGGAISAHVFSSFPRRSRHLTVRVYAVTAAPLTNLATFRVPNPAYKKYPVWKPEPLPIIRETNGLTFTVTRFNTGLYATGHQANMGSNWTEIIYNYEAGPWRPEILTITDATGNLLQERAPSGRWGARPRPPGEPLPTWPLTQGVVTLSAMLWQEEPAWKVHLELERWQRSRFPSNTWWDVPEVAVPPRGQTNQLNLAAKHYGTNVIFKSLAVVGNRVRVELHRPKDSPIRVTLLQVTEPGGTNILFTRDTPAGVDAYLLDFKAADARALNFRFAIHHRVTLEFLAKPQLLNTNIARDDW